MGLDQYWIVDTEEVEEDGSKVMGQVAYHRKVPSLEDFMSSIWAEQHNRETIEFNCESLEITIEILDRLDKAVKNQNLNEEASRFFWGQHQEEDYREIMEASAKARDLINKGRKVYYTSWW